MIRQNLQQFNFVGGLNLKDADFEVMDHELTGGQNAFISLTGIPSKRYGYELVYSLPFAPKSAYTYYHKNLKIKIYTAGTKLYHGNTEVFDGFTSGQDFDFEDYLDDVYMVNGKDGLFKDDGVIITDVTPDALQSLNIKSITKRMERLWVADDQFVYFSNLGDPETFDGNSLIEIPLNKGEKVTKITNLLDNIVIFTSDNVLVVRGTSDPTSYSLESLDTGIGLIAPKSLQNVDGSLVGLSHQGLFNFNGTKATLLPNYDNIRPLVETYNPAKIQEASAFFYNRKYGLCFPSLDSETNNTVAVYDLIIGAFLPKWTNINAQQFFVTDGEGDTNELFFLESDGNNIYKFNKSYSDNEANIDFQIEHKNYSMGGRTANRTYGGAYRRTEEDRKYRFKYIKPRVASTTGNLQVFWKFDVGDYISSALIPLTGSIVWGQSGVKWGDLFKWGQGLGFVEPKVPDAGASKHIKLKIRHNDAGNCQYFGFVQFYVPKRAK